MLWSEKFEYHKGFQSYQGSIFTNQTITISKNQTYFQSYQGSIFTEWSTHIRKPSHSFNPIKVLFLRKFLNERKKFPWAFQSYQGSIFTFLYLHKVLYNMLLSILSRFYFYCGRMIMVVLVWTLSILSRFYFYRAGGNNLKSWLDFQSYQGSIFTEEEYQFFSSYIPFNPIKVLFLRQKMKPDT